MNSFVVTGILKLIQLHMYFGYKGDYQDIFQVKNKIHYAEF